MTNKLVDEFKTARENLIGLVNHFPPDKREEPLFDTWSLKDILCHLTGWANHQLETLQKLKRGEKIVVHDNIKTNINENLVLKNRKQDWKTIYDDFVETSNQLIFEYDNLSKDLWRQKIWSEKETTPRDYIKIEINHYQNTHGPQIEKILDALRLPE